MFLTFEQIKQLQAIVKERQQMTEHMLYFCQHNWTHVDREVHMGYMGTVWHSCQDLWDTLEGMREINTLAADLASDIKEPVYSDYNPVTQKCIRRRKHATRSSSRIKSKPSSV